MNQLVPFLRFLHTVMRRCLLAHASKIRAHMMVSHTFLSNKYMENKLHIYHSIVQETLLWNPIPQRTILWDEVNEQFMALMMSKWLWLATSTTVGLFRLDVCVEVLCFAAYVAVVETSWILFIERNYRWIKSRSRVLTQDNGSHISRLVWY